MLHQCLHQGVNAEASSVLMVESADLALVASIISRMNIGDAHLLVDNRLLVNYINGLYHSNPPDWTIIPFTQIVNNLLAGTTTTVHNIKREHNQMADSLARQSISSLQANLLDFQGYVLILVMIMDAHFLRHSNL
jgi:hypothetical protein